MQLPNHLNNYLISVRHLTGAASVSLLISPETGNDSTPVLLHHGESPFVPELEHGEAAENFLRFQTLYILVLGAVAFAFSTAGGVVFAKSINLFLKKDKKINPCIGAAGVSAVPMAARVVQKFVSDQTDGRVNPLMPAMGPNVAGVIGSAVAAGVFLALLS